jgi:DNA-binding beta-propeller fold protein YncE
MKAISATISQRAHRSAFALGALLILASCTRPSRSTDAPPSDIPASLSATARLPTGVRLDPAGRSSPLGNMPLSALLAPDGRHVVVSLSGWREQGLQIVNRETGALVQRIPQSGAFIGLAFSADGATLYASGGATDRVYVYAWRAASATAPATLVDSITMSSAGAAPKDSAAPPGLRYVSGVALSHDGRMLYVAENLADSLAVVDLASRRIVQKLGTGSYPYAVVAAADGRVYVSDWGAATVHVYHAIASGRLVAERPFDVGRHPSALALSADGSRLFAASASTDRVAAVDTRSRRVVHWLLDPPPDNLAEGSTPDALALSASGTRLYVAEADVNAVAVFDLSPLTSGIASARGTDTLAGRIPTEWYPTAVLAPGTTESADSLLVINGKGRGAGANPKGPGPERKLDDGDPQYTLGQLNGTLTVLPAARGEALSLLSRRVAEANGWTARRTPFKYPPIEHVVYIIKENRTYDQVLGDLLPGDGDTTLTFFPRALSPNHHALAERFGTYDRFFVNAEVSNQGHPWSTAGYVTDYLEKTTPDVYRGRRPEPDEPGDVDDPAVGYLWDAAARKHLSLRNYGEGAEPLPHKRGAADENRYDGHVRALLPSLQPYTNPSYPPFDMTISDQRRADIWIAELREYERAGRLPALEILHLPRDHTAGLRAGLCTPRACMADNDLALGRIIDALSHSQFWRTTAVFVLEDDSQDGPDHVDSHRSVMFTISPWARGGVVHRFVNTTDVLATIEELLGLDSFSHFDHFGRPLREIWRASPDMRPYVALTPAQPLSELNLASGPGARASADIDLAHEDRVDDAVFNHILWRALKGTAPYPTARRLALLEAARAR